MILTEPDRSSTVDTYPVTGTIRLNGLSWVRKKYRPTYRFFFFFFTIKKKKDFSLSNDRYYCRIMFGHYRHVQSGSMALYLELKKKQQS